MRIGIDIRSIGKRGTGDEVYTTQLIRNLARSGEEHMFFLFTDDEEVPSYELIQHLPANMQVVVIPPAHRAVWMFVRLPRYARAYNLDLLHVQYITPPYIRDMSLITTIHDVSWKVLPASVPFKDRLLLNMCMPKSVRSADHVLTVSHHSKEQIERFYPASHGKVTAIYNGGYIDPADRSLAADIDPLPSTSMRTSYILHMSSLQPRKNVPQLLRAYASFLTRFENPNNAPLCVIAGGEGVNYDTEIDTVIIQENLSNYVLKTGHVSEAEKYRLYAHAELFVSLSLFEGFGIPFVEAMSFGIPVLGANRSCLPEIIGEAGDIVDPEDTEAVANKLFWLCTDSKLHNQYACQGMERAQKFTWERMAQETQAVYEEFGS